MIGRAVLYLRQFDSNLWVLASGWFVGSLGFAASMPFVAIYFHSDFEMSMTDIGMLYGVMAVFRSVFQGIGGEMSDRIPRRWLLVHSQTLRAVSFLLLAAAIHYRWGFWPVVLFLFITQALGAVFQPAANAMVSDIVPPAKRLDGYAFTRSAVNLGWAAGPAIGGFLASSSFSLLFVISSAVTLVSGLVFWIVLRSPLQQQATDSFHLRDIVAVKDDRLLARHSILSFLLYLVVSQLIVTFSVYSVDYIGISKTQLGYLYTINGLLVVALQVPATRLLSKQSLTRQLAYGSFIFAIGYGMMGVITGFNYFVLAIVIITLGEVVMSPASLALTSRLAPADRMGRYMGIYGFFVGAGWSFGPLVGGWILEEFGSTPGLAWALIASLAIVSGANYLNSGRRFSARAAAPAPESRSVPRLPTSG
jgi:MFS family permease